MGEVYRARDGRLGRDVALKILPDLFAANPERRARFDHEAKTVAALNHPNIVTIDSVEECGGTRFLTMEIVEGQTIDALIPPQGLPLPELLRYAIPIVDAVSAAHDRHIVHRDLKPSNLMVTRDGGVKVLDFGLAKFQQAPVRSETAQTISAGPLAGWQELWPQVVSLSWRSLLGVVGTLGAPPADNTRCRPVDSAAVAKIIVLSSPQVAPRLGPSTPDSSSTGPPVMATSE